jgi:hypothetical protein
MRLGRTTVAIQLSRLALEGRTGVLRVPGDHVGTIHFYEGLVTGAESRGTPGVASRLARWSATRDDGGPGMLTRDWVIREAIADAALAMLPRAPRAGRFTASDVPAPDIVAMTTAEMLTEVDRRTEVLKQLPATLTADTVVARNPRLRPQGVHVSAAQWALLMRMNEPVTPRTLAMEAGTSVFTTTLLVFRLISMNMVAAVSGPLPDQPAISFTRATAG